MTHLRFGEVDLVTSGPGAFLIEGLSSESGTEWGSPQPVEVTLSNMRLGPLVVRDGWEARVVFVAVRVRGVDSGALADAEAALWRETGKPNTLTWQPADGKGAPSVFEVMTSSVAGRFDDLRETLSTERTYVLRLVCRPFVRSTTKVTTAALQSGETPTTVVVADGSSTTGWTGNGTVTTSGGFVKVSPDPGPGPTLTYTASIDCTTTRYLRIRVRRLKPGTFAGIEFKVNGVTTSIVGSTPRSSDASYFYRTYIIDAGERVISSVTVECWGTGLSELAVDYIERTNLAPVLGTGRQLARQLDVPGSAPTEGSLRISSVVGQALGTVLAYTWRDDTESGWLPPIMAWLSSGGATADSDMVSGQRVSLAGSGATFTMPAVMPHGSYVLLGRMNSSVVEDVTFTYTIQATLNGSPIGPAVTGTTPVSFGSTSWVLKSPTGLLSLPTIPLPDNTEAELTITLAVSGETGTVQIDEGWLFNTDVGRLSWLGNGAPASGGPASRVWINSPTIDRPFPQYLIGTDEDGTDAFGATAGGSLMFPTEHVFEAGTMNVFTVTTGTEYAEVELDCYPRAPFHAAS